MAAIRLTAAQALVRFLAAQHVERDGERRRFFGGCFGIFGHGDVSPGRGPAPGLQQLQTPRAGDVSVNDAFRPVSRYFDRISRPEQVVPAALAAMRVLTSPAETGAVTLAFPQDVQAEAFDCPE